MPKTLAKTGKSVGIDVGLADLAITSDGDKYAVFNADWLEKQAIKWQSKYNRRKYRATIPLDNGTTTINWSRWQLTIIKIGKKLGN